MSRTPWDAIVIGAGAAGMMCAAVAGQRGARVLLVDHAERLAEKIRISGGGRCNFTNIHAGPANFISENPAFCRSALARYTAGDFIALVKRHRIRFHEKHKGQLFCDESSERIIEMLVAECDSGRVHWMRPVKVGRIGIAGNLFEVATGDGVQSARRGQLDQARRALAAFAANAPADRYAADRAAARRMLAALPAAGR